MKTLSRSLSRIQSPLKKTSISILSTHQILNKRENMASTTPTPATKPAEKLVWDFPEFSKMYVNAEKITGPYGKLLLQKAGIEKTLQKEENEKLVVLDQACGTGVVTKNLMEMLKSHPKQKETVEVTCADFADSMVEFVGKRSVEEGWGAEVLKCDAMDTKLPAGKYSHILFNFGPFLLPSPSAGMSECHRMLTSTGTLALTSWKSVPWIPDVRDAFATNGSLPRFPSQSELVSAFSKSGEIWDTTEGVTAHLENHGFVDITVEAVENRTVLKNVEEFLFMLPGTLGILKSKFWSEEEREKWGSEAERIVEEWMRGRYGEGEIVWDWVAIVATGRKAV